MKPATAADMANTLAEAAMAEILPCLPPEHTVLPHHFELMRGAITRSLKTEIEKKMAAETAAAASALRSSLDHLKNDVDRVLTEVTRIQNRARVLKTHRPAVHLALAAAELANTLSELNLNHTQ